MIKAVFCLILLNLAEISFAQGELVVKEDSPLYDSKTQLIAASTDQGRRTFLTRLTQMTWQTAVFPHPSLRLVEVLIDESLSKPGLTDWSPLPLPHPAGMGIQFFHDSLLDPLTILFNAETAKKLSRDIADRLWEQIEEQVSQQDLNQGVITVDTTFEVPLNDTVSLYFQPSFEVEMSGPLILDGIHQGETRISRIDLTTPTLHSTALVIPVKVVGLATEKAKQLSEVLAGLMNLRHCELLVLESTNPRF